MIRISKLFPVTLSLFLLIFSTASGLPAHAAEKSVMISSFTTSVRDQDPGVKTNIAIAAAKLNGVVIPAGGIFSFNSTVGEGSSANGYLAGRVLYMDTAAYEPGGGICQVSSTLFNALLLAGCDIKERHRHSSPVLYTPHGLDATIRYGKKDLIMKNTNPYPICIYSVLNDRSLTIIIKGDASPVYSYEVYSEEEEINLPLAGEQNKTVRPGISVYIYRKKLQKDKMVENTLLYKDFYPPVSLDR